MGRTVPAMRLEVLRLAAAGRDNREVAEALFPGNVCGPDTAAAGAQFARPGGILDLGHPRDRYSRGIVNFCHPLPASSHARTDDSTLSASVNL